MRAIVLHLGLSGIHAELLQQLLAEHERNREEPQSDFHLKLTIEGPDEELLTADLQNISSSHKITDRTLVRDMTLNRGSTIRAKRNRSMCRRCGYHF